MTPEEKVMRYRNQYLAENHIWYSGPFHYLFNGTLLAGSATFLFLQIDDWQWNYLWTLPVMMILGSLAVYLIHRYPLHQKYRSVRKETYDKHTLMHHRFYTNTVYRVGPNEKSHTFLFPPLVVILFCGIFLPVFFLLTWLIFPSDIAFLMTGIASLYFILYEIVHYTSHLPSSHWLMKVGYFRKMRKHHLDHHDPRLMEKYNFNIVLPLFDYLFRTKITSTEKEVIVSEKNKNAA